MNTLNELHEFVFRFIPEMLRSIHQRRRMLNLQDCSSPT
uniref:Uncharacterized protein n=1 Tax=Anguilla anguilla TaxID=7936 RepID=A0A0E9WHB6_ANGAN